MAGEVALINTADLGVQKYDDKQFDAIASSKFLPRLQLMTSSSQPCKDGTFPINHYAMVKGKTNIDLTSEVNLLVVAWRPKALRMGDAVMAFYDVDNPEFTKIVADSEEQDSGCMFGPEFLCYVPAQKEFVTFFMGSKSSRNESPNMKALLGKAATLRSQKISNKKYTWQSPEVVPCSTPFDLPSMEELKKVATDFNNPPQTEIETVEEKADARVR